MLLRGDKAWVCVEGRNIGRKLEWKVNFKKELKKSRGWRVEECYKVRKEQQEENSLSNMSVLDKDELSSPEEKTPHISKKKYGKCIDIR